jgi:GT2 family glycosyltransferase
MTASVDVLVVTYGSAAVIEVALASAKASQLVRRTIVVDNASRDGSAAAARLTGADIVIENEANIGFAAAVNRGLLEADAELIMLLNPDAALEPGALELLVTALHDAPVAAMAGPLLVEGDGRIELGARRFSTAANRLLWHVPMPARPAWATPQYRDADEMAAAATRLPVDYLWGAALLVRRAFLDEIGGLDERFFLYSEDEDLGRQARARGRLSLLVPPARARHIGGASTSDEALALARVIVANELLLEKWGHDGSSSVYRRLIGPVLSLRAVVLRAAGRRAEAELASRTRDMLAASFATGARDDEIARAWGYVSGTWRVALRALAAFDERPRRAEGWMWPTGHPGEARRPSGNRGVEDVVPTAEDPSSATREPAPPAGGDPPTDRGTGPTISVILPIYNTAGPAREHLSAALRSIAAQTVGPLELVVVDDGSTDDSAAIVATFGAAHPALDLRVLRKENGGQSSARNHGARAARGEWLAFLDQDDEWTPDHLELVAPLLTADIDLVYTDIDTIDEAGHPRLSGLHRTWGRGGGHPDVSLPQALFQDAFVVPGVMTIRRAFFERVGGFDEELSGYEDDDLFVRCLARARIGYLPASTLRWRIHAASASHTGRMITSGLAYWRKLMARHAGDGADQAIARRLTLRFVRTFLSQASLKPGVGDGPAEQNLAAAESLMRHLGAVDRVAFAAARWGWRSDSFAARCARAWFLSGLERP